MTTTIVHNQLQIELIDRLSKGMAKMGWGQMELSRRSGVPQPTISHVLSGYRPGNLKTWDKLLTVLEAS